MVLGEHHFGLAGVIPWSPGEWHGALHPRLRRGGIISCMYIMYVCNVGCYVCSVPDVCMYVCSQYMYGGKETWLSYVTTMSIVVRAFDAIRLYNVSKYVE